MQIDFRSTGAWFALNEKTAQALGIEDLKVSVRNYRGVGHALAECTQGLARLFPLKKKVHYFKGLDPMVEPALLLLAREGYQLIAHESAEAVESTGWIEALGREDLFVLYSVDDPLLGRSYNVDNLEALLREKSILRVRVSHARHFYETENGRDPETFDRSSVAIYGLGFGRAMALVGERARVGSLVADQLPYDPELSDFSWFSEPWPTQRQRVLEFEARGIAESKALFKESESRVFDRAAIYWTDLDGHAVIDRIAAMLNIQLKPPGEETRLECASLSRWGGVRTLGFYENLGYAPEVLRGTVLIGQEFLDGDGEFEKILLEVRRSILEDQFGDQ